MLLLPAPAGAPSTKGNPMSDKPISAAQVPGFDRLTPKEQTFVQHPDVYRDPQKAALDSGYSSMVATKKAYSMRKRLMAFIQPAFEVRLAKIHVDRTRVEEELAAIAFTIEDEFKERIDIETPDGGVQSVVVWKDPMMLPEPMRRAIKCAEYGTETLADGTVIQSDRPINVVLHSKEKALKELAGLFGDVAPRNPVDEQQELFDNLSVEDRETLVRIHLKAARRAALKQQPIEGTNAHREETVRRLEAPSPRSGDRERRLPQQGREAAPDHAPDVEQPAPVGRVRGRGRPGSAPAAPRRARATPAPVVDGDTDVGFSDLPD
jgi:hypothetical protein